MALLEPPGLRSLERTGLKPGVETNFVLRDFPWLGGRVGSASRCGQLRPNVSKTVIAHKTYLIISS